MIRRLRGLPQAAAIFLVATVSLAMLVGFTPNAEAAAKKRSVSLTVSATTVTAGTKVTLSGTVKPSSKKLSVKIQRRTAKGWQNLKKVKLSPQGKYKYQLVAATPGQLKFRAYVAKSGKYRASHSPTRSVRVTPKPKPKPSPKPSPKPQPAAVRVTDTGPTGIDVGQTIAISGTTSANLKDQTVQLQIQRSTGWSEMASVKVTKSATYAFKVKATEVGRRQLLRVHAAPTPTTAEASSATVLFSVYTAEANREYLFKDEFTGNKLDPAKWGTRHQSPAGRRLCAQPSDNMVSVSGGMARLKVSMRPNSKSRACPYGVWDNGMIGTSNGTDRSSFVHGTFAARVRFQPGAGMHGSFWLQGKVASGAEIDVAEYFGDGRSDGGLSSYIHYTDANFKLHSTGGSRNIRGILRTGETPSNGWHIYSVDWDSSGYIIRLDGYPTLITSQPYVATTSESLVLSLLTSDWELPNLSNPSSTMYVDWVRAWN